MSFVRMKSQKFKEILWKVVGDVVLDQFIKRTDSLYRTKHFANISFVCGLDDDPEDLNIITIDERPEYSSSSK